MLKNRLFHSVYKSVAKAWGWDPSHDISVQLVRSLMVSAIAVVINFGASYFFKEMLGIYYLLSATISFFLGVLVNYYLSVKWVFAARQLASKHAEFMVFVAITSVGLALNLIIIAGLVEMAKFSYWPALSLATVIVFFWNFVMRKSILY